MSLNSMCREVIDFYSLKQDTNDIIYIQKKNKIESMKRILDENLLAKKAKMLLSYDITSSYNIYVYYIAFLSDYLTEKEFHIFSDKILRGNTRLNINPIMYILKSNYKLTNDLIYKIILNLNKMNIDINDNSFGEFPFDYRYYLLKREEIPKILKKEILNTYSKNEIEYIDEIDKTLKLIKE